MPVKIKKLIIIFVALEAALALSFIISQRVILNKAFDYVRNGETELAIGLLDKISDIDAEEYRTHETLLGIACEKGNKEMIFALIEHGADPNKHYGYLLTPLESLCSYGYESGGAESVQKLITAGAKLNEYTNKPAIIILASKTYYMNNEQKAIATKEINVLFKNGAKLSFEKETVLHYAAQSNMADLFSILIQTNEGISLINSLDAEGRTPYQTAIQYGSASVQRVIRGYEEYVRKLIEEQNQQDDDPYNDPGLTDEELINQLIDINQEGN